MKVPVLLAILFIGQISFSQENNYFDKKGISYLPSLKNMLSYEKAKENFTFFDIDEQLYNSIFYKGYINERGSNSHYSKFDLILLKEYTITSIKFPDYKFILNPGLKKSQYSKHLFTIYTRDSSVTTNFHTKNILIEFPNNILMTNDSLNCNLSINTDWGIEHNNIPYTNTQEGINIKEISDFKIPISFIPNSIFTSIDFNQGQLDYRIRGAYDNFYYIIEENNLSNFIYNYNEIAEIKKPRNYNNAFQFKHLKGKVKFIETFNCNISELYFFENIIAGVLEFSENQKEQILDNLNEIENRSYKIDENRKFPKTSSFIINETFFKIEQGFNEIKMYFFIIK